MDKRYQDIAKFLRMITETIEDGDIGLYARDPDSLIDFIVDELERNY